MQGNSNWSNYGRNNRSRSRPSNNRGTVRSYGNRGNENVDNDLPSSYTNGGSRQSNAYSRLDGNMSCGQQQDTYVKHFKAKTFPPHRSRPYDRPHHSRHPGSFQRHNSYPNCNKTQELELSAPKVMTPLEAKIERLINAVRAQAGIKGQLVFLQTEQDSPTVVLQNAVQSLKSGVLAIKLRENQNFELSINGEAFAEGTFQNKQTAKSSLCETVIDNLRKKCFYIIKKRNYEEVSNEDISRVNKDVPSNTMEGSKAHLMMLKMGWGGKGLGLNEQGSEKTVAETLTQNVTKAGLGEKNVMTEIHGILEKFAASTKVTTLAFDSGFTKEERAHIHSIASKFNLKSKSEGRDDNRRITISKKIAKWNLIRELLLVNCENDSYKLLVPSEFESLWSSQ